MAKVMQCIEEKRDQAGRKWGGDPIVEILSSSTREQMKTFVKQDRIGKRSGL